MSALGITIVGVACHRGPNLHTFREAMVAAAGRDAQDCGFGANETQRIEATTCATKALQSKRAFFVAFEGDGIDSRVIHGLAVNNDGLAVKFLWDSDIYGGGSRFFAKSRIDRSTCEAPVVSVEAPAISCANHAPGA